jgi:serine/threonine protein kinase
MEYKFGDNSVISPSGKEWIIGNDIASGTYGRVVETNGGKIMKIQKTKDYKLDRVLPEIQIQQKLSVLEPGTCPIIYEYGIVYRTHPKVFVVTIMERYDGTVDGLFKKVHTIGIFMEWLDQTATTLHRLEKYQFNHRDLKPDNMMYRYRHGKYQFVLIDFGFACATFGNEKLAVTMYYQPEEVCFRKSRDLCQLLFAFYHWHSKDFPPDVGKFVEQLLTFETPQGQSCKMFQNKCSPYKIKKWLDTYEFTNRSEIENPNAIPAAVLESLVLFKDCLVADQVINLKKKACVSPRKTRRASVKPCPEGTVLNPPTGRCVKIDGAIGKKLKP